MQLKLAPSFSGVYFGFLICRMQGNGKNYIRGYWKPTIHCTLALTWFKELGWMEEHRPESLALHSQGVSVYTQLSPLKSFRSL